jgi:hypothetical protein
VCAAVIADEIGGRLGASLLLGPSNGQALSVVTAAGAAAATAWLDGMDARGIAHALALACSVAPQVPLHTVLGGGDAKGLVAAVPAVQAIDAVELAKAGATGPLDLFDSRDGLLATLAWVPLRNAFTGLGRAWLTETLAYKLVPGCAYAHVPVQAVQEVLRRHAKAADKRLRPDQVERIEISTVAPGWVVEQLSGEHPGLDPTAIPFSIRRSVGVALTAYELGPSQLDPTWLDANRDAIAEVARRTEVRHDWSRTWALLEHMVSVATPLFAGLTAAELRDVGARARSHYRFHPPLPGPGEILAIARHRPDRLLDLIRRSSGDLGDARLDEFQFLFDTEVKVFTIRGGSWPERRALPEGSPGWPWDATVDGVCAKWGDAAGARALLDANGTGDAEAWVEALLA